MNEKLNLTRLDGTSIQVDTICFLEDKTSTKRYIFYTLNEVIGSGASATVKIYVGKVRQNNVGLDTPITEEEWSKLKGYMGEALKGIPNDKIKYLPLSELTDATIVNERVIAMPSSYDYINKHRGIYAQSIATGEESGTENVLTPVTEVTPEPQAESIIPQEPIIAPEIVSNEAPSEAELATVSVEPTVPAPETVSEPIVPAVENTVAKPVSLETPSTSSMSSTEETITNVPVEPTTTVIETQPATNISVEMKPIDISEIEKKYSEMQTNLENLKNLEIEAAKRYNATLELNAMHNEQHASYVASEQNKEASVQQSIPESSQEITTATTIIEPVPVTPVVPTPVAPAAPTSIETNWFDMPAQ